VNTKLMRATAEVQRTPSCARRGSPLPSIERTLDIAEDGKPGRRRVRLLFPIDSDAFFVPGDHDRRDAA
jgi:hypothetical protein